MRNLKLLSLVCFYTLCANVIVAQGITFTEGSWEEIVAQAKQSEKGIFVDVYTDWCGPCKMLDAKSFPDTEVGSLYNQQFVNLKVNAEKGQGVNLARGLNVLAYPTMLYFDSHGVLLLTIRGYKTPFALLEIAKMVGGLNTDALLVEILDKESQELNKADLNYLLNHTTQFYNKDKASYYNTLYSQMSLAEKRDPKTSKLFLFNYGLLQDEELKEQVIRNYQKPESLKGVHNDHIRIQHDLKNALITEVELAKRNRDILGFRRKVDLKLHFLLKTNKVSARDTLRLQREADLTFYDHHNEVEMFSATAKTLMEESYLPSLLKNDLRAHSGQQAVLIKTKMTLKKLIGHSLGDPVILGDVINWCDQLIDNTEIYDAYLIKAKAYHERQDLVNLKATITEGLAKPVRSTLRKDLESLLRRTLKE